MLYHENMEKLKQGIIVMISMILLFSMNGFTVKVLFNWFIVGILNIDPITFIDGIGITIIVSFIIPNGGLDISGDSILEKYMNLLLVTIYRCSVVLCIGYLASISSDII